MKFRKPFRMKWLASSLSLSITVDSGALLVLLGAIIALVQTPVVGVNVPYDKNNSGVIRSPDPTDIDFSYSYVLNKDVRYRKPKYFSNVSPIILTRDKSYSISSGTNNNNDSAIIITENKFNTTTPATEPNSKGDASSETARNKYTPVILSDSTTSEQTATFTTPMFDTSRRRYNDRYAKFHFSFLVHRYLFLTKSIQNMY